MIEREVSPEELHMAWALVSSGLAEWMETGESVSLMSDGAELLRCAVQLVELPESS